MTLRLNKMWFCSLDWNPDRPKLLRIPIFLSISKHNSLKLLAWVLPSRSPSRTYACQKCFFFKMKTLCCLFHQSFLCLSDGKFLSGTAPLVWSWRKTVPSRVAQGNFLFKVIQWKILLIYTSKPGNLKLNWNKQGSSAVIIFAAGSFKELKPSKGE